MQLGMISGDTEKQSHEVMDKVGLEQNKEVKVELDLEPGKVKKAPKKSKAGEKSKETV
jgi:hypothetical protein